MQDRYGHRISYLRVSITDRCNERCTYCMPHELQEWLPREEILNFEETLRLIRIATDLGVSNVRITGGEPLTRRGVLDLIRELPKIPGLRDIGLSTNGTLLAREVEPQQTMAAALRNASVRSVNISLDTLNRNVYSEITGRDLHPQVLNGIDAAITAGFDQIKLNTVLMRGRNEDQLIPLIEFAAARNLILRFIDSRAGVSNEWTSLLLSDPEPSTTHRFYRCDDEPSLLRELQQTSSHLRWKVTSLSW